MSRVSILKRSIRTAAAAFVLIGLLSPANAADQELDRRLIICRGC